MIRILIAYFVTQNSIQWLGMALFEEALQKWELALTQRQSSSSEKERKSYPKSPGASDGTGDGCEVHTDEVIG